MELGWLHEEVVPIRTGQATDLDTVVVELERGFVVELASPVPLVLAGFALDNHAQVSSNHE